MAMGVGEEKRKTVSALDIFYVGTVVRLKGANRDIMIIGYGGLDGASCVHDYIGVPYPMGFTSPDMLMAFDTSQISKVIFFGHGDALAQEYIKQIVSACESGDLKLPMLSDE